MSRKVSASLISVVLFSGCFGNVNNIRTTKCWDDLDIYCFEDKALVSVTNPIEVAATLGSVKVGGGAAGYLARAALRKAAAEEETRRAAETAARMAADEIAAAAIQARLAETQRKIALEMWKQLQQDVAENGPSLIREHDALAHAIETNSSAVTSMTTEELRVILSEIKELRTELVSSLQYAQTEGVESARAALDIMRQLNRSLTTAEALLNVYIRTR